MDDNWGEVPFVNLKNYSVHFQTIFVLNNKKKYD